MRIGVIGSGISGLTVALDLARQRHEVVVFERDEQYGGLLSTLDLAGTRIERYYHFLCGGDDGYLALTRELGLEDRIVFRHTRTGFYHEGIEYPFTSPIDLLRFSPIPLTQRVRFGLLALEARVREEWRQLDEIPARPWLVDRIGQRGYDVIWHPLLNLKFGSHHDQISAAWVWHRLHRVARSKGRMGYLEGGTGLLLDTLLDRIRSDGGTLHSGQAVTGIAFAGNRACGLHLANGDRFECDAVVSTIPLTLLADLLPPGHESYAEALRSIEYIGVVCVVFKLKRNVTNNFWLNIHDTRISTNGIIEYTNLNDLKGKSDHIVYMPYYVPTSHPLYAASDDEIARQSWQALPLLAPGLRDDDLIACQVSRSPHAQAICSVNFLERIPGARPPVDGLYVLDSVFLYPEDRTQSGLILHAKACARGICQRRTDGPDRTQDSRSATP